MFVLGFWEHKIDLEWGILSITVSWSMIVYGAWHSNFFHEVVGV